MLKVCKKIIFIFVLIILTNLTANAQTLEFAQIGDINYNYENGQSDKYIYFLNLAIQKQNLDFAVFLGDNVEKSTEENVIGLMRNLYYFRIPYYLVLGNNDAHKLSGIEKDVYLDIVTTFNHNQKDRKSYYYFKPNKKFICVVLDDSPDFVRSNHGELSDEQIDWLEKLLKKHPKKMFLIFQHSPVNPPRDEYKLSLLNTDRYKEVLKKYSNIVLVSSGHYRQNSVQKDENGIYHISAPAFFDDAHSFQLIKINYDEKHLKSPKDLTIDVEIIKV